MANAKGILEQLLTPLGIQPNGPSPWDPQIHDQHFYDRVLAGGSLALGESYMDGWWDCPSLDGFFARILEAGLDDKVVNKASLAWALTKSCLCNLQSCGKAHRIGEHHYDLGNDLFRAMLDKRMIYSCAYWKEAGGLEQAQEAKLDLICRKLKLAKGQRLLDIGCGWGGLAAYAAETRGVEVLGLTVSRRQAELGREMCRGLPVEIRLQDYRLLEGSFDAIVSVGMFEHVGHKNYRTFMEVVHRALKPGGLFLLHTIGGNASTTCCDPWIEKYIFPGGLIPSAAQIGKAAEELFVLEDWHSFGADYDKTLMAWQAKFSAARTKLEASYGSRFGRMWSYYLLCCAGSFRARKNQLWQIMFSKEGLAGGYQSER